MAVEGGAADPGALGQGIDGDLTVLTGEVTGGGEDRRLGPRRAGIRGAAGGVGHLFSLDAPAPGPPDCEDRSVTSRAWARMSGCSPSSPAVTAPRGTSCWMSCADSRSSTPGSPHAAPGPSPHAAEIGRAPWRETLRA